MRAEASIRLGYIVLLFTPVYRLSEQPALISLSFDISADDDPVLKERLEELHSVINRLGHIDRALIILWLDGYAYNEIAEITGLSESNVAVKLMRAKNKIKEMFNA